MGELQRLTRQAADPFPILFASLTGSRMSGTIAPNSDYDIQGAYILPARAFLGFGPPDEAIVSQTCLADGLGVDISLCDIKKFCSLLVQGNGRPFEALFSPYMVIGSVEYGTLRELAAGCVTKKLAGYYAGMARQNRRTLKESPLKGVLSMYRCALTGLHLMHTGFFEMGLSRLAEQYDLPFLHELIARRAQGQEMLPDDQQKQMHVASALGYVEQLEAAALDSQLPDAPTTARDIEEFVISLRR